MIVLHAIWENIVPGKLHIWSETSDIETVTAKRASKTDPTRKLHPHPFALTAGLLIEVLEELYGSLQGKSLTLDGLAVRLPSKNKGPLPSPELLLDTARFDDPKTAELHWWNVVTASLDPAQALDFLLALPITAPPGIAFGDSLRFWTVAANLAFEIISRQSFAPILQEEKRGNIIIGRAVWDVVLAPEDAIRVQALARAMPPVCWSYMPPGDKQTSLLQDMLHHFLQQTIDAYVRGSLQFTSLLPASRRKRRISSLPLHEQWLHALSSSDPAFSASASEMQQFSVLIHTWLDQLYPTSAEAPFRTCFRLEAPPEDEEHATLWRLSFYLQANDDPSLLVPAEQVWQECSDTLTFLEHKFAYPQERLLTDLGKAARLFPLLDRSLREAHPREVYLHTEQAYAFLRESVPLLEQSGFGMLVPPWWQKRTARVGVKLKVKPKGDVQVAPGLLGLNSIVDYKWDIAIGDQDITPEEFEQLAQLKLPLVKIRGQWVELRPDEIEAAIAFFEKKRARKAMSLGEALRIGLGEGVLDAGLPVLGLETDGWIKEVMEKLSEPAKLTLIEPPATLQGQLRPYQQRGVSWLAFLKQYGFGACLADHMGLGKCILGNTGIFANGLIIKAENVWSRYAGDTTFDSEGYWANPTEQLFVNAIDETTGKIVQATVKHLYRQQVSTHLRKVRLEDGSCITITYPHKLLTNNGWTNDLHIGDYVCVPAKLVWEGQPEDPDLIKFLAWQISEGSESRDKNIISIVQKNISILEELKACLLRLGKKYNIAVGNPNIYLHSSHRAFMLVLTNQQYRRFLENKGYKWGKRSCDKCIPDFIMQADLNSIRIFLRNFFEAEASAVASMRSIEISTASPVLIQQLSYLLRRFGIWMRISTKMKRATNGARIERPYQIGVLGGNAARKFCKEIGFAGEEKQRKLEKICEAINNTNVEGIPASEIMAQTIAATRLPVRHFGMHNTVYINGTQQFSPESLGKVAVAFDKILSGEMEREYREMPPSRWTAQTLAAYALIDRAMLVKTRAILQHLLDQEVFYCRIKEIEDVQYEGWVYDFEVERHHNFVANNIICHNTIQLITLLLHERDQLKAGIQTAIPPTLLVCPMSIVGNWQRELQRFAPSLQLMVHHGMERLSGETFIEQAQQHDIVITTYSLTWRDREYLGAVNWDNVVLDEAQNIKNESARQTQAIKSLHADYRIALTGTPVENRLSELWSIMEFLNPGYLGSGTDFRQRFAIPIERYHDAERSEALKHLIQPFVLRRVKTDKAIIQDLPDKMEMKVFCNLTSEQASLYEAAVKEMLEKIEEEEGMARRGLILAALLKLKQICNHPAQFLADGSSLPQRSGKLARLEEMLGEVLAEGDKALIFTQFAEMGELLRRYLQETLGCETLFLHGGTAKKQRDAFVQRFQEERRGAPLFILSLKAGGVGLNLTAANHVFHFDRWWNPAVENQATDRAFRIGQKKNVQVHKFVCVGTLEERIDQMIEQKKELAENIVGSGENWLTEMSTSQLKELFTLSREAVGE